MPSTIRSACKARWYPPFSVSEVSDSNVLELPDSNMLELAHSNMLELADSNMVQVRCGSPGPALAATSLGSKSRGMATWIRFDSRALCSLFCSPLPGEHSVIADGDRRTARVIVVVEIAACDLL